MIEGANVKFWACTSAGSCIAGLVTASLPYLQFIALIISIAAGVRAWIVSRKPKS